MSGPVLTLYRPVGQAELDLIEAADGRAFPPRLEGQPIFYPVTNEEYATQIARDWNTKDGGTGYVTRFGVLASRKGAQRTVSLKDARRQRRHHEYATGNHCDVRGLSRDKRRDRRGCLLGEH